MLVSFRYNFPHGASNPSKFVPLIGFTLRLLCEQIQMYLL